MRLLIFEDDRALRRRVIDDLEAHGVTVTAVTTAAAARTELQHTPLDVAILGLDADETAAIELLRALRADDCTTHVIILSTASTEAERVRVFELGADDHVTKPFFVRELTARVLAVRRRLGHTKDTTLQFGAMTIDLAARQVTVDDLPVELTVKEFDLLAFLATSPRRAFSRDELLQSVWQSASDWQHASTVTEHVRRLRSKLERDARHPRLVQTVRGFGYRFDPPAAA
jgi:DNA-binding response OmpR family regulator